MIAAAAVVPSLLAKSLNKPVSKYLLHGKKTG